MSRTLGIFARQPVPGRVKTRLAAAIGADRALELYRALLADLLSREAVAGERRVVAYAPGDDAAADEFRRLAPSGTELWPQPEGTLGDRLTNFFRTFLQAPEDVAIAIGTDSPTLPDAVIKAAFEESPRADAILGPATDGGYYLIGFRGTDRVVEALVLGESGAEAHRPLLADIEWGGPRVLTQTVARLQQFGLSIHLLPPWYDVDTPDDLVSLTGHLRAMAAAGEPIPCPHTARILAAGARAPEETSP